MPRTRTIITTLLLTPAAALSQGFFVGDPAAVPASMGAAYVAYPDSLAIAPYNPAGIVRVKDGVMGDLKLVWFTHAKYFRAPDERSNFNAYEAEELDRKKYLGGPFFAVASDFGLKKWKFAYSTHVQFGSKLDFDENGAQRYMMKKVDLHVFDHNFSGSYAIDDRWSVGAALIYVTANVDEEVDLDLASLLDPTEQPSELPENRIPTFVSLKDTGFAGNVGLLYDGDKWKLGFLYQTRTKLKLDGDVRTDLKAISPAIKQLLGVGDSLTLDANMELNLPQYARLGAAWRPKERWWLTTELFWIDWSTLEKFDVLLAPNVINVTDYVIPRYWDDGIALKFGMDHKVTDRDRLRAGTFFVNAPTKQRYVQLDIPDNNRAGLTVGWSHEFGKRIGGDVAYVHQFVKPWHIDNSAQNPHVNGDIYINFGTLLLSLRWNF